uniref:C3H1-type domain-containing protein n=1 Tax=Kalanchoe fedtschenkoi TaxID=63787 RepID=A0A7N0U807_KALFE
MEGYVHGRNPGAGGSRSQSDQGGEGYAEESTWRLGFGGQESYPERPDEADCRYYLRTGFCGYGERCRFNHPPDRTTVVGVLGLGGGEYSEYPQRVGQPVCKYFMMTGTCRFGSSCKYHHPRQGGGTLVSLNYLGYPLRPGEKECSYYIKTCHCKFGVTCKFHHPQPSNIHVTTATPGQGIPPGSAPGLYPQVQPASISAAQPYGVMPGNWQVARPPTMFPGPYIQGPYASMLVPHGMVPVPEWGTFSAHVSPALPSQPTAASSPLHGITQLSPSAPEYTGLYSSVSPSVSGSSSSQKESGLPERPGQPECQYYMKTGDCKYGSSCRYHHPPELIRPETISEPANLPIRPGAPPCIYFAQYGVCKYGYACKYDHSSRTLCYSPSASSLTDMPEAPVAVGSSTGTVAASSSSSDLHQEIAALSIKDSSPHPTPTPTPIASSAS